MEKIIALTIRLDGSKESVKKVDTLTTSIRKAGVEIDTLLKKGNQLAALQKRLDAAGSGSTTTSQRTTTRRGQATDLNSSAQLRRQIAEARAANVSVDALIQRVGKLKAEQAETNREIRAAARAFEETKAAAGSYRAVNAQLVNARDNFRQLGKEEREGPTGQAAIARIRTLDRELKDLDRSMGIYARNVGNYSSAFERIGGVALRAFSVVGIALSADQIVDDAARISDSIANVEKVSGLAAQQARELADQLRLRDTRTSLNDQLAIAETGGRVGLNTDNLGIEEAQRQLLAFTDAIDTANVALGDQFDNDAQKVASTLAGLRNVLTDFRPNGEADIGGDLLRIGNALNFLETQGNSTAPVIADFVNRIGGIAVPLGASTESIFALGATLDELEVTAERGGTAISNTLGKLAAAPEKFAQQVIDAGLIESSSAFTELVNNDIISALTLVAGAVQENSSTNTEFAQSLQDLGITGARAQEVFAKLGGASERYNTLLDKSQQSLSETTSLTDEFSKKNDTLAGDLAKLRNSLVNTFSSDEVQDGLRIIIGTVSETIAAIVTLPRFVYDNRTAILLLVAAYASFNAVSIAAALNTLRLAVAQRAGVVATKAAAIAQRLFNTALRANPIGAVVTVVLVLAAAFTTLFKRSETVRNAVNSVVDSFRRAYDQSLLLKAILGPLGLAFKLVADLFAEGPSVLDAYVGAVRNFANNVPAFLEIVKLKFRELALTVREALSFGGASDRLNARLSEVRSEIEAQQRIITNNNKGFAEREIVRKRQALAKEAEADKEAAELAVGQTKKLGDDLTEQEKENEEKLAAQAKSARERAAAAREQAAKDRLAAARRITDLENGLIRDRFARREAEARTAADRDVAALVGDPEQIKRQADLIKEALRRELDGIAQERQEAYNKALEQVAEFGRDLAQTQADNGALLEQANLDQAESFFNTQEKAIKLQAAQQQATLLSAFRNGEVSYREFTERRQTLSAEAQAAQIALAGQRLAEETALDAQLTDKLLEQAKDRFNLLRDQRDREQLERDEALLASNETGDLSDGGLEEGLAESRRLRQEQERAELIEHETEMARIASEFVERGLDRQQEAAEEQIGLSRRKNKQLEKLERDTQKIILDTTGELGESIGKFLSGETENYRDFAQEVIQLALSALEKLIILSISSSTAQSLAQPDSVATFGASGLARAAVLTGLIKGAFAGIKAAVSSFEFGGVISEPGNTWSGGTVPATSGPIRGRRHTAGGIRSGNVEVEDGEFKIQNGPESYIVNRLSTAEFRPMLERFALNPGTFSPSRRAAVSAINAHRGYGIRFRQGGVLSGQPLAAPLNADGLVPFRTGIDGAEITAMRELSERGLAASEAAIMLAEETNARIDRIEVVVNPGRAVRAGRDQLAVEAARGL